MIDQPRPALGVSTPEDPYPLRHSAEGTVRIAPLFLLYVAAEHPLVLMSHWPLVREPTRALRHQQIAQGCGTVLAGAPE